MPWFTSTSSDETAADTLARISRLEWIYIRGVYFPATRRVRDPANWYPSFKAADRRADRQEAQGPGPHGGCAVGRLRRARGRPGHAARRPGASADPPGPVCRGTRPTRPPKSSDWCPWGPSASTRIFIRTTPTSSCSPVLKVTAFASSTPDRTRFLEFCRRYLRSLYPPTMRIAIVLDNFSPHLTTKKDTRVGARAAANNVEFA